MSQQLPHLRQLIAAVCLLLLLLTALAPPSVALVAVLQPLLLLVAVIAVPAIFPALAPATLRRFPVRGILASRPPPQH